MILGVLLICTKLILTILGIDTNFLSLPIFVAKCGGFKQFLFGVMAIFAGFGLVGAAFTFIPSYREDVEKFQKTKQDNIEKALQVEEQNRKINSEFSLKKSIVEEEYSKATSALRSTEQTLAQLYNAGVVYQKYQGLIPITMFCEYIASGRCTDLVGHEGAYNIYESEIRLNLIIIKLNDIIKRLNEIKENQYMLADMMQKANRELENLTNIAAQQAQSLNRIEANTAVASYYSGISAMNTTYLAWAKRHELLY